MAKKWTSSFAKLPWLFKGNCLSHLFATVIEFLQWVGSSLAEELLVIKHHVADLADTLRSSENLICNCKVIKPTLSNQILLSLVSYLSKQAKHWAQWNLEEINLCLYEDTLLRFLKNVKCFEDDIKLRFGNLLSLKILSLILDPLQITDIKVEMFNETTYFNNNKWFLIEAFFQTELLPRNLVAVQGKNILLWKVQVYT